MLLTIILLFNRQVMPDSFVTPWTAAHQASLSMGFPRQEHWSGLPFPSPGDLPDLGMEPVSPALADGFFTTEPLGKHYKTFYKSVNCCNIRDSGANSNFRIH